MPKCTFSGESIPPGQGIMYITKDGKTLYFKNSKAKKNFLKLKRKPVFTKWTAYFRAEKAKHQQKAAEKKPAAKAAAKPAKKAVEKAAPKAAATPAAVKKEAPKKEEGGQA